MIDLRLQKYGYGRQAIQAAITMLRDDHGCRDFALSYQPANQVAKKLYRNLGFVEMSEWEDDEVVARLSFAK